MNGVRINRDGDNISINLHIIVYYGYNIPQLSYEIQSAIKNVIEEFTGLKVDAVNISVEGIDQENDLMDRRIIRENIMQFVYQMDVTDNF